MGLCVAVELIRSGQARLKVYVNGEVGDVPDRYRRFADCLSAFNRRVALQHLRELSSAVGEKLVPAFVAVDVAPGGIGRLKLYFRPTDGGPALMALAAKAAGCPDTELRLAALHRAFLTGPAYPAKAVDVSVEFPADDNEPGFKVDLRTIDFLGCDAEVDLRIRHLLEILGTSEDDYRIVRDSVVESLDSNRVAQIVFVGLASRLNEHQVDVYFHPAPSKGVA
jgi:hypothetical protein